MDTIDIRKIDMTLLLVFQGLVHHRKLTTVAERLGLTQSTISHALKRLRELFRDELFIRRPTGVEPTARALELHPIVSGIIELTRRALDHSADFDPARARGVITLGAPDYHAALITAPLLKCMRREASGLQIAIRTLARRDTIQALVTNDIDLAVGYFWRLPDPIESKSLFADGYSVIARHRHPLVRGEISLATFLNVEHLVVSLNGELQGIVDRGLAERKKKRTLVAAVPSFFAALATVSKTDLIATLPSRLAAAYATAFGLQVLPPPISIRPYRVSAIWHERNATNPIRRWLVERISAIVAPAP